LVNIYLSQGCRAKKKIFDFDFEDLEIKGRGAGGNIVTKYPIRRVDLLEKGKSSLGAVKFWMDKTSGRLNKQERGKALGKFDTGDLLLVIYTDGTYMVTVAKEEKKIDVSKLAHIGKFDPEAPINSVYFDGQKKWTMVKRFLIETTTNDQVYTFITEHGQSKLNYVSVGEEAPIVFSIMKNKQKEEYELDLHDFIDVKGWKSVGNKLGEYKILKVTSLEEAEATEDDVIEEVKPSKSKNSKTKGKSGLNPGDTIEFDF